ncbi:hypothetical protein [Algibacter mikhailovii]|uniref:hypothetical protein n=1 Tax=Algibacter mikhailovii TaxID=425498 RepID=UPI002494AB19|nr:hypothetical protein [Algibacter mikhailovii]
MLPFKQAIKLPFDFYYKIRFENLSGKVILNTDKLHRGMIKIGARGSDMFSRNTTIIDLSGTLIFLGATEIGHGCLLKIERKGVVTFGYNVRLGALTKVFCSKEIIFGNEIDFSWECQVFDTNFHYLRNTTTNQIAPVSSNIRIGSYNWFGNRCTVMKGTITSDYMTIASNSLCNKSYLNIPNYSILGGYPAKLLCRNRERIFENIEDISNLKLK